MEEKQEKQIQHKIIYDFNQLVNEVKEDKMIEAIYLAHDVNLQIIEFINKIVADCGKEKHAYQHSYARDK